MHIILPWALGGWEIPIGCRNISFAFSLGSVTNDETCNIHSNIQTLSVLSRMTKHAVFIQTSKPLKSKLESDLLAVRECYDGLGHNIQKRVLSKNLYVESLLADSLL